MKPDMALTVQKINPIKALLTKHSGQIKSLIPANIPADKLVKMAINILQRTPALQQCSSASILNAVVSMAALGLSPDPLLGQAFILPYKTQAQLIVGYRGWIALLRQSVPTAELWSNIVYEEERFEVTAGLERSIVHVPERPSKRGDQIVAAYAVLRFREYQDMEVMWAEDIEAIRDRYSPSYKSSSSPWQTASEEMYKKTVIRRLMKRQNLSETLSRAVGMDEVPGKDAYIIEGIEEEDMTSASPWSAEVPTTEKTVHTPPVLPSEAIIRLCDKMALTTAQDALDGLYNEAQVLSETNEDMAAAKASYEKNTKRLG
jgi:phage RecT family recombinase